MGWNIFGIAIPTNSKKYDLDEIANFISENRMSNASIEYDRNIHNTTIERHDVGIFILNHKLSHLLFNDSVSLFEEKLFTFFDNPECILGIINTDEEYKGYACISKTKKRIRVNSDIYPMNVKEFGDPISEELIWLNASKMMVTVDDLSYEASYFEDNKEEYYFCWEELEQIQITLMKNRFGRYWQDTDGLIEMKNYTLNLE